MQAGTPSATAISVASLRAAHLHLFNGPKIHEDTFALQMSGAKDVDDLKVRLVKSKLPDLERVSAYFACRHRFSEDRMRAALDRGVRQVVLLGAGLDTLALRQPDITTSVRLVEIDHPASQRWKLERLQALGFTTAGVHYAPVDFSSQDLGEALGAAGVRMEQPTFFGWLGVTQYVSESSAIETLSLARRHAVGSEIVFDVIVPFEDLAPNELHISSAARASSQERGEPWISFYRPEEMAHRLLALGFATVQRLTSEDARRYYVGQPSGVIPLTAWQLISAIV
jgi:methyltransferase (TIGR00027 family)